VVERSKKNLRTDQKKQEPLNIIIIGFDSASHGSYERNLPLLQKWISENTQKIVQPTDLET
jgi:hypothetical protein